MKIICVLPQVGDKVKCLDFIGNEDHWVSGTVEKIGFSREGWLAYSYSCAENSDGDADGGQTLSPVGSAYEDEISGRVKVWYEEGKCWVPALTGRKAVEAMKEEYGEIPNL
jgi:hypothetical protein